jgi:hypothetical protein
MASADLNLPFEIEAAVAAEHGGPITITGQHGQHVVMSAAVFHDMMGLKSVDDLDKSVAALKTSLAQAEAGQMISLEEARQRLLKKHGA